MARKFYIASAIVWIIIAAALWSVLYFLDGDLLWRIDSRSLFLYTSSFTADSLFTPGGFTGWLGAFFQQFLYHPGLGAVVKVSFWMLFAYLFAKVSGIRGWKSLWLSLPVAALIAADMQWGYAIFQLRNQGFFFSFDIGAISILLSILLCRSRTSEKNKAITAILWTLPGYFLFGGWSIIGSVVLALDLMKKRAFRGASAVALSGIAAPLPWMPVFPALSFRLAVSAALPVIPYGLPAMTYLTPFIILVLCLAAVPAPDFIRFSDTSKSVIMTGAVSFAASLALVAVFWFEDANFRAENAMCRAVEKGEWKEVADIHSRTTGAFEKFNDRIQKEGGAKADDYYAPTRAMVLLKNLALFKLGTCCAEAFSYKDGSRLPETPLGTTMMYEVGKQMLYFYGLLNFCWRWTTEDYVQNGWNVEDLKYLVRVSAANGNTASMDKYLNALKHTMFHRKWTISPDEMTDVMDMKGDEDILDNDGGHLELYLSEYFTRPHTAVSPGFGEASLLWAMQSQDIGKFRTAFSAWLRSHPGQSVPRNCQEAVYLYNQLEGGFDMSSFALDDDIPELYRAFMEYGRYHPFNDPQEQMQTYYRRFGRTFFYFYYFIRDLKTY